MCNDIVGNSKEKYRRSLPVSVAYAEGGSGGFSPQKNFGFSGLKMHGFSVSRHLTQCIFTVDATSRGRTILLFFHACSVCIPTGTTSSRHHFFKAPLLQGRKLVIGKLERFARHSWMLSSFGKKLSTILIVLVTKLPTVS